MHIFSCREQQWSPKQIPLRNHIIVQGIITQVTPVFFKFGFLVACGSNFSGLVTSTGRFNRKYSIACFRNSFFDLIILCSLNPTHLVKTNYHWCLIMAAVIIMLSLLLYWVCHSYYAKFAHVRSQWARPARPRMVSNLKLWSLYSLNNFIFPCFLFL